MNDSIRIPPHSIESEQAVLGAILMENRVFDQVAEIISEKDFYSVQHRIIWRAIESSLKDRQDIDVITLSEKLGREGTLEHAGGIIYLGSLTQTGSRSNAKRYAQVMVDRRIERDLLEVSARLGELAHDPSPIDDRLQQAQYMLLQIGESTVSEDPEPIGAYLMEVVDEIEQRMNRDGDITGLSTGLSDLDDFTLGMQPSDLIIIAGRPSMGKTALAVQIAEHTASNGNPALVFSMEMSRKQLIERFISNRGRVDNKAIRKGKLNDEEWSGMSSAMRKLKDIPLIVDERPALTSNQIRAAAKRIKRKHGLSLIVIDYLQLMRGTGGENRNQEVSEISRDLKALAKELNIPVICLSQLSRECEKRGDKRPIMSDLRDSGSIEQDADIIAFVYREEVYKKGSNPGVAELLIRKHRMGATGDVYLTYLGEYYRFENSTYRPAPVSEKPYAKRGME